MPERPQAKKTHRGEIEDGGTERSSAIVIMENKKNWWIRVGQE